MSSIVGNKNDTRQSKIEYAINAISGAGLAVGGHVMRKLGEDVNITEVLNVYSNLPSATQGALILASGATIFGMNKMAKMVIHDKDTSRFSTFMGGLCLGSGALWASANLSSVDNVAGVALAGVGAFVLGNLSTKTR